MAGHTALAPVQHTPVHRSNGPLLRWFVSYGSFAVPQAAAPIAFSLVALPLTGDAASGAAMMLAMTVAQVLGAVPITRFGRRFSPIPFVRVLIGLRTLALVGIAVLAGMHAPFGLVVAGAALAGLVNGAAYGTLRAVLNHLVPSARLPRSLGVAATLNEVTFVASPVLAAALGSVSPQAAVWAMVVLGMGPMLLLPRIPTATAAGPEQRRTSRLRLSPMIMLWLVCGGASAGVDRGDRDRSGLDGGLLRDAGGLGGAVPGGDLRDLDPRRDLGERAQPGAAPPHRAGLARGDRARRGRGGLRAVR